MILSSQDTQGRKKRSVLRNLFGVLNSNTGNEGICEAFYAAISGEKIMTDNVFTGKFLRRNLHLLIILLFLIVFFILFATYGSPGLIVAAIILVPFFLFVLFESVPENVIINDEGISILSYNGKLKKKFLWNDITGIEEAEHGYRDTISDMIFNFLLYGIFSLYFGPGYRSIKITDNQDDSFATKDFKLTDYDGFIQCLQEYRSKGVSVD